MKIALMQPYLFPYIGYYQLVQAVDEFIFFDDVNFSKKSFISRNTILVNGVKAQFRLPVVKKSQNRRIQEHEFIGEYDEFFALIRAGYEKTPYFDDVFPIVEETLSTQNRGVAKVNAFSIQLVSDYLGLKSTFSFSSELAIEDKYKAQSRVIKICKTKMADCYVNSIGGLHLYDARAFKEKGINLKFLKPRSIEYRQNQKNFVPSLSIIDVLMWNSKDEILELLGNYDIIRADQASNA